SPADNLSLAILINPQDVLWASGRADLACFTSSLPFDSVNVQIPSSSTTSETYPLTSKSSPGEDWPKKVRTGSTSFLPSEPFCSDGCTLSSVCLFFAISILCRSVSSSSSCVGGS